MQLDLGRLHADASLHSGGRPREKAFAGGQYCRMLCGDGRREDRLRLLTVVAAVSSAHQATLTGGSMIRQVKILAILLVLFIAGVGTAHAQATRTWVSGVGDDANPCSRTAPCKTFAGAISKTAPKGVISILDPGGYGAVTITKSITIDGGGIKGSVLNAGTNGVVVNAGATDIVRLRDISIDGGGSGVNGVRFISGGALILDNVKINDMSGGSGILFSPNTSARLVVSSSVISNNTGGMGIYVLPGSGGSARVSISGTTISNNAGGVRIEDKSVVSIQNSTISSNSGNGIAANSISQPVEVTIDNSQITNNGVGVAGAAGVKSNGGLASVIISGNTITGNENGLAVSNGADIMSFGSNRVTANENSDGSPTGTLSTR